MSRLNTTMDIFKLLDKSNCGKCNEPTCLAFAASVFKGQRQLGECPSLAQDIVDQYGGQINKRSPIEEDMIKAADSLKKAVSGINLSESAEKLGGVFANDKLTIKICGKDFSVDSKGNLYSDIHVHPWIAIPFLNYILTGGGVPVAGKWVPFRELKNGKAMNGLFVQRCEKPLKRVADIYTDLFEDMIHLFDGKKVENHYESDISLVLKPLPKVPMLICYWKPEEDLESSLNIFFDETAEDNLPVGSIFALGAGIARMFEKIALRHGVQ